MKNLAKLLLLLALLVCGARQAQAQTYAKLNGLYALVGVINPAFEFTLSRDFYERIPPLFQTA